MLLLSRRAFLSCEKRNVSFLSIRENILTHTIALTFFSITFLDIYSYTWNLLHGEDQNSLLKSTKWWRTFNNLRMTSKLKSVPCWPVLGNICVILVARGFPGSLVRAEIAGRKLLTEARGHWGQTALGTPCCWCSGSERLVSTKRTAARQTQFNRDSQCSVEQHGNTVVIYLMCRLPCRCRLWTLWTCTEPAAARAPETQLSPE